eukprot:2690479-Amphidinium_carterae.1
MAGTTTTYTTQNETSNSSTSQIPTLQRVLEANGKTNIFNKEAAKVGTKPPHELHVHACPQAKQWM